MSNMRLSRLSLPRRLWRQVLLHHSTFSRHLITLCSAAEYGDIVAAPVRSAGTGSVYCSPADDEDKSSDHILLYHVGVGVLPKSPDHILLYQVAVGVLPKSPDHILLYHVGVGVLPKDHSLLYRVGVEVLLSVLPFVLSGRGAGGSPSDSPSRYTTWPTQSTN